MMKSLWIGAISLLLIAGCAASSHKTNQLQLGMSKAEVVEAMGNPNSTSAAEGVEYLRFKLQSGSFWAEDYYVRIKDGQVDAFGRVGDFGLGY